MSTPSPSTPTSAVLYTERLRPSIMIWVMVACLSAASTLIFIPISVEAGFIGAAVAAAIMVTLLLLSTPVIRVTPQTLQVGRAEIERRYVGNVEVYRGDDATHQRGPGLNATAYLCIRGWISPVVRIEITDPADRTPYWLTSSRHPEELAEALRQNRPESA